MNLLDLRYPWTIVVQPHRKKRLVLSQVFIAGELSEKLTPILEDIYGQKVIRGEGQSA